MAATLVSRTLGYVRRREALAAVVERWNAHAPNGKGGFGIRQDLWGMFDVLAVEPGQVGVTGIQVCAATDLAKHVDKLRSFKLMKKTDQWTAAQNRIRIYSWSKPSEGGRRKRWALRIVDVTAEDVTT